MLFTNKQLEDVRNGSITLAFRSLKKAAVKKETRVLTPVGRIEIQAVQVVVGSRITGHETILAGYYRPINSNPIIQ